MVLILCVGRAHTQSLRTLEAVAAEKASLLRFLRPAGFVVLNGDDPHVSGMSALCGQAVLFGSSEAHAVRHWGASSVWPERLSFQVEYGDERALVRTQFVGVHRLSSVAGAIAVAAACGVPLRVAVQAVKSVQPFVARLQPVTLPSGAVLLRDEYNASIDSFQAAARVLREARAGRRILIVSDCSDWRREPRQRMRFYAQTAKECADAAVFLGERSAYAVRSAVEAGMPPENVHAFLNWEEAVSFLQSDLRDGDLALLRGISTEHLSRLYFSLIGSVACRKSRCPMRRPCDECSELGFRPHSEQKVTSTCAE